MCWFLFCEIEKLKEENENMIFEQNIKFVEIIWKIAFLVVFCKIR